MRCPKTSDSTAGLCLREVISAFTWKSDLNVPVALFRLTKPVVPLQFCSGPRVQLSCGAKSPTEQWEAHLYGLVASVGLEPRAGPGHVGPAGALRPLPAPGSWAQPVLTPALPQRCLE